MQTARRLQLTVHNSMSFS